uniref:PiggyBac transposable element-derived protein domain-containing protein n=1 Tax=Clastoptera arizonana TaxID=38151 RepID=A0A1B6CX35_9HEMI
MSTRTAVRDIVHRGQQPNGEGKNVTNPLEAFSIFFSESLFEKLVKHTNSEIVLKQQYYKNVQFSIAQTNKTEIKALIGILVFSALHKDNHLSVPKICLIHQKVGIFIKLHF